MTSHDASMAVAMPLWTATLSATEVALLTITDRVTSDLDCWWVVPKGLEISGLKDRFPRWRTREFAPEHFKDVRRYSHWMTSPEPYEAFDDYEFITVCQTDAVLVKSPTTVNMDGIDFIGSVWDPPIRTLALGSRVYVASDDGFGMKGFWVARTFGRERHVGNGGLSSRRIEAMLRVTQGLSPARYENARWHVQEDALLAALGHRWNLRIASKAVAQNTYVERTIQGQTTLPDVCGFHALERWNPDRCRELVMSAC